MLTSVPVQRRSICEHPTVASSSGGGNRSVSLSSVVRQQAMPLGALCTGNGNGTPVLVVAAFAGSYRNIFCSSFLCFDSWRSCDVAQHSCMLPQVRVVCVCIGIFDYVFVLYNIKQWKTLFRKLIVGNGIPM